MRSKPDEGLVAFAVICLGFLCWSSCVHTATASEGFEAMSIGGHELRIGQWRNLNESASPQRYFRLTPETCVSEIGLKATQHLSSLVEEVNQLARNQRKTFHLWLNHGGGIKNWRAAIGECKINPGTAPKLNKKWTISTSGDITATPAIADGVVYFPTWSGEVFAVDEKNGSTIWRKNLTQLIGTPTIHVSRHTPVVDGEYLLVGLYIPAQLLALHRPSGNLVWSEVLDADPNACITMSGTTYKNAYFVGVASLTENTSVSPIFQGSMLRLDITTGKIKWQTKMLPNNGGKSNLFAGAGVWGSSPPIDVQRNLVYLATGNLYSVPPDVLACQLREANKTVPDIPDPCVQAGDYSESILALDLDTGKIVWGNHLGGVDIWNAACLGGLTQPNCPAASGPDYDFGEAPMMLTVPKIANKSKGGSRGEEAEWQDIVVAGQKSGFVWALDRDDGHVVWDAVAGPGGVIGGASWGSATDGERVYTSIINNANSNFTLVPASVVTTSGGWVALNATSGVVLWSTATPDASYPIGPVSFANGVVFGTSLGTPTGRGWVYALDATSGKVLWRYNGDASISGGASIHEGCVFVGEGMSPITKISFPTTTLDGRLVHAFCVT